ncbi:MAG TPA: hypothetical protein PLQ02_07585, partial [Methanofastidiosum sp.]|nr:hypothetical protein [Methanofastidiosum sp.]
ETSVANQVQPVELFQAAIISFPQTNFFPFISIIVAVLHHLILPYIRLIYTLSLIKELCFSHISLKSVRPRFSSPL